MTIWRRALRASWPAAVIAFVVFVVFHDKPFNIDDTTFLVMAEHMLEDPLHPASVQFVLNGRPPAWISAGMWSGPVAPAMLVPSVAAGGAEWLAHAVMLFVFVLGIVSTAAMGLRLGISDSGARLTALVLTTSAAVLAMASTNMPDVPAMSFAVFGAERLLAFRDHGGVSRAVVAAAGLALAALSRQHAGIVYACLAILVAPRWPRSLRDVLQIAFSRTYLSSIAVMVGATGLVFVTWYVMRDPQSEGGLATSAARVADYSLWRVNLPNVPMQWVLSFPLAAAWIVLHGKRMPMRWWCWVGVVLGVYLAHASHLFHRRPDWMPWQAPLTALGAAVLFDIVADAIKRRDIVDLGLALWLLIMVPIAVYTHMPPKYFVPSAPAMAILLVRSAERRAVVPRRAFAVIGAVGLALGLLIIRADAVLGEVGRQGGAIAAKYVQRGERVWYDGTWAFQWYSEQAGARPVFLGEPKPERGDIVVVGLEGWVISKWPNKTLVEKVLFDEPGGRILQKPAGFFSNVAWGPLPWVWSKRAHDPVEVWRIE